MIYKDGTTNNYTQREADRKSQLQWEDYEVTPTEPNQAALDADVRELIRTAFDGGWQACVGNNTQELKDKADALAAKLSDRLNGVGEWLPTRSQLITNYRVTPFYADAMIAAGYATPDIAQTGAGG